MRSTPPLPRGGPRTLGGAPRGPGVTSPSFQQICERVASPTIQLDEVDPTIDNALMFSGIMFQSLVLAHESGYDVCRRISLLVCFYLRHGWHPESEISGLGIGCSPLNNATCFTPNSVGWSVRNPPPPSVVRHSPLPGWLDLLDPDYATNSNFDLYVLFTTTCLFNLQLAILSFLPDITKHFWTFKHSGNFIKREQYFHVFITNIHIVERENFSFRSRQRAHAPRRPRGPPVDDGYFNPNRIQPRPHESNTTDSKLTLSFPDTVCPVSAFRTSGTEDFATVTKARKLRSAFLLPLKKYELDHAYVLIAPLAEGGVRMGEDAQRRMGDRDHFFFLFLFTLGSSRNNSSVDI
ncbi:hypothetical protein MVEN_01435000 [Mycena venus]|uniref:Uncharacterized protein n=1 Tax=Mycena venus TaxID=2733690 RepID=A0A8H6XVT7_9AGAR|nr:hypothetical protein MVEN_01435000 [Mycena venus]